ncbi:MAG: hypothetical protein H6733_14245 [Alphaproteobacteria bacterium]|nr:hypothetical protein [Alphaproteobacteria bacterium]
MSARLSRARFPIETVVLMGALLWATADRDATWQWADPHGWVGLDALEPEVLADGPYVLPSHVRAAAQDRADRTRMGTCALDHDGDDGVSAVSSSLDLTL